MAAQARGVHPGNEGAAAAARRRRRARPGGARRGAAKNWPLPGGRLGGPCPPAPDAGALETTTNFKASFSGRLGFISHGPGSQCVVKRSEGSREILKLTPRVNACGLAFSSRLNTFYVWRRES